MKKTLITGITGQDGSYLAELLLEKNYEVHGIIRRSSEFNTSRIDHLYNNPDLKDRFILHYGDLTDSTSIFSLINLIKPDEVYNLGAQSHVKVSFEQPEFTANVDAIGTLRLLEAIKQLNPKIKFYQASSSEMFGKVQTVPQTENTPFYPRSPYGCAKVFGYWITVNYRESYKIHASNGILFNHESERRGKTFVTRKITRGLARIQLGLEDCLVLGNLDSQRDWGHAKDYVEAMWLMLQQEHGDDYVIATNEMHTVREFVEKSAKYFGYDIEWQGNGLNEIGIDKKSKKVIVKVSERYFRPAEVDQLLGNPKKAQSKLNWKPKITFDKLIELMCENDLKIEKHENR